MIFSLNLLLTPALLHEQKLEESQSQIQALRNDNSIIVQSKVILESKLEISRETADAANTRVESLSGQLRDSQSEIEELRHGMEIARQKCNEAVCAAKQVESELKRTRQEKESTERELGSRKSRSELQGDINKMQNALKEIKELESIRSKKTQRIESELQEARDALSKVNSVAAQAVNSAAALRGAMDELEKESQSLRAQLKRSETPAGSQQWNMEWQESWEEGTEGIEIQMNGAATPNTANLENINAMGAEDVSGGSQLSDHVTKIPLKAVLQRTPDSASRQLKFASSKSVLSAGKENHRHTNTQRLECSLCFHPPRPNGAIKSCACGKADCNKWAHASCLLNRQSVSSCVSHPGTPAPPLPTILCDGIWAGEI